MPLQATSGAASYDAFGGGVAAVPNYIEDVFSTWLYTGNGSTQTINNGIDLAGKGGLVWVKGRQYATNNGLTDTARGVSKYLFSDDTMAQYSYGAGTGITAFNSNGFTAVDEPGDVGNGPDMAYASWTFREQPKFFDVVTYTGNGSATQTINHNLGSVPGCIIIKVTSQADDWYVYHRSLSQSGGVPYWLNLNTTAAETFFGGGIMLNATPTSTSFTVKGGVNGNGNTYVAYLFAHNAGGFGLSGTDNVISCGSFTTNGSAIGTADLGYEPQWILLKAAGAAQNWFIFDSMRGMTALRTSTFSNAFGLNPNTSDAETDYGAVNITATGFATTSGALSANTQYIYIAIRRGPMRTPTTGTSVFSPLKSTTTFTAGNTTGTLLSDWMWGRARLSDPATNWFQSSRLTPRTMPFNATNAEDATQYVGFDTQTGVKWVNTWVSTADNYGSWYFRRAPGFFDVVCYSGVNAVQNVSHNLGVAPELMIVKRRNSAASWFAYAAPLGATRYLILSSTAASDTSTLYWNDTEPTSSVFTLANNSGVNAVNNTYVAYLFATCPGVSKVFSYTGNGSSQTINCGFTGGARFVMIKRTDSTGDWYVWDTARGIVANNDPHLSLNSTAAEVTTNDTIDTDSTGFVVNQVSATNVNVNGASYIGLAIA